MEYIHSKDIFLLMRDTLKMIDRKAMDHGSRVAYYLYKMLECKGGYEKFELADFVCLASLHDIGAYKTENLNNVVGYECKEPMFHSAYGYLVFKHLSPLSELASVILYHHTDYSKLKGVNYEYKEIATYLNLAEKIDIYSMALGDKFELDIFEKQVGTVISREALDLFHQAMKKYNIMWMVKKGGYKEELADIASYMIFTNEDKRKFLEMLMYCQGFKKESYVVNIVACLCMAEYLGEKMGLSDLEKEQLYNGVLLHDIGMLAMPRELTEAPRRWTPEEHDKVKMHVHLAEKALNNRMAEEVVAIIAAHHERCDGSGYPRGLRDVQMSQTQKILQVTDTVTALLGNRPYRPALKKEEIVSLLKKETAAGKYNRAIVHMLLNSYDEIMKQVKIRSEEILLTYRKLNQQYKQVSGKLRE